jgi:hypothetical protein
VTPQAIGGGKVRPFCRKGRGLAGKIGFARPARQAGRTEGEVFSSFFEDPGRWDRDMHHLQTLAKVEVAVQFD